MAFAGFGANNNNSSGFGSSNNTGKFGFGATSTGFGSNNTNTGTGFGSSNTGSGLFGGGNNNSNTAGGSTFGGFGASTSFGASNNNNNAGSSLFGGSGNNTNQSTGFGGFGANSNTANTSTPAFGANNTSTTSGFGSNNAGSSLFGGNNQQKPAFGGTTGGGLFGSSTTNNNNTAGTGFGSTNNTASTGFGGFGANTGGAFGQQATPQNQGTAATPFEPFQEKDATANGTTNVYQTISCQPPYQKFSLEELRLADYNAGRRYGNPNGQAGAFGQSTGFGGFGQSTNNNTSSFGANNNTGGTTGGGLFGSSTNAFGGQQNTATTGFGANNTGTTGGGLFGNTQNNNTGGGLFGGNNTANNAAPSGGLFGNTTNTTGGFGANANTGGGLFGSNNNNQQQQDQNKPFGGGFGNTSTNTGNSLFGNNTANSNPFGQNNTSTNTGAGGLFGNTANTNQTQQPAASGGLFGNLGQNNQNNQAQNTGGGLFGGIGQNQQTNNQQKPGGLFGNTTGGGLFGNNQQQAQPTNSLFGNTMNNNNNNNQASGGLFGAKPAASTPSLFGNNTASQPGNSLFGNNNNQAQTQQTSLFGNNQNQAKPSLFGNTNTTNTGAGTSLFGNTAQNNNQGLFGGSQNAQPLGGSLFGQSQQQAQPQQQMQQTLTASLAQNPYGNDQLFANLGTPAPSVGPLATPLSGAQKPAKRTSIIPAFKINPGASMRLITPQKSSNNFGLSYSTYGTPGSAQSFSMTRGSSILGAGGLNRPLSKSLSTSNLRTSLATEDNVLTPGAFTANHRPYNSTHSIRKLRIDRSLRTDIFGDGDGDRPTKRVSFDNVPNGTTSATTNGDKQTTSNALVLVEDTPEPTSEELGLLRAQRQPQKDGRSSLSSSRSERTSGNELAIVPENGEAPSTEPRDNSRQGLNRSQSDQEPGEYYMIPSLQELRDMSKVQLKNMSPFIVGRVGVAKIEFSKVDLTTVPLEQIMGNIVKLNMRSATVYESGASTPPQGKGLNVPSRITLENSWPRSNGGLLAVQERKGPRFDKHIERLKRVTNTEFIDYNAHTGEWTFSVQHFTTYGLDDYDDDEDMTNQEDVDSLERDQSQQLSTDQDKSMSMQETSMMSPERSDVEDTFEFKKGPSKSIPGGFGDQSDFDDAFAQTAADRPFASQNHSRLASYQLDDPFRVSGSTARPASPPLTDDGHDDGDEQSEIREQEMAGSYSFQQEEPQSPLRTFKAGATPMRQTFDLNDDWAAQLQRTVSPRKQDRQALREVQNIAFEELGQDDTMAVARGPVQPSFNTTLDIMNSLWGRPDQGSITGKRSMTATQGFKWPYSKRTRPDENPDPNGLEQAFHASVKPHWNNDGVLTYAIAGNAARVEDEIMVSSKRAIVGEGRDIRFASFAPSHTAYSPSLAFQLENCKIITKHHETTAAQAVPSLTFATFASKVEGDSDLEQHERRIWALASILFDPLETSCSKFLEGVPSGQIKSLESRVRRDAVLDFWIGLTSADAAEHVNNCSSGVEKALAYLSAGNIEGACIALAGSNNLHLATVVAQLPSDETAKQVMRKQINHWRGQNLLSEMSKPIRALYAITAGETCVVEGKTGAKEDRAETFALATELGLDWRRAFGLRLFYASSNLATAVQQYIDDVAQGKEVVKPVLHSDVAGNTDRQDPLLGLLQLYAQKQTQQKVPVTICTSLVNPFDLEGSPIHARLAWQLATTLRARQVVSAAELPSTTLDDLAQTLSLQLETIERITDACHILMHLSSSTAREYHIEDLLNRRASLLTSDPDSPDSVQAQFTEYLKLPPVWFWNAKAQYAGATADHESQAAHFLQAGDVDAAHRVLCRILGPRAVVSGDYDTLREVLGSFMDPASLPKSQLPDSWRTGGQVYFDYIHLLDLASPRTTTEDSVREDKVAVLKRLAQALPSMLSGLPRVVSSSGTGTHRATTDKDASATNAPSSSSSHQQVATDKFGLEERVAISEMAEKVRSQILALGREEKKQIVDDKAMSRLPVPDDAFVKHGVKLTGLYYRAIGVN